MIIFKNKETNLSKLIIGFLFSSFVLLSCSIIINSKILTIEMRSLYVRSSLSFSSIKTSKILFIIWNNGAAYFAPPNIIIVLND